MREASRLLANEQKPAITIVVVALEGGSTLARCLNALVKQQDVPQMEVIVPLDDRLTGEAERLATMPNVRAIRVNGQRTYAELRALGVQQARGRIVALTEDHCIPRPAWCLRMLEAHREHVAAVGGAVEKYGPDTVLNWAFYLADYARYMNPLPAGQVLHLSDCNVSYKRAALDAVASAWSREFHERVMHHLLQEQGGVLWFSPDVVVDQQRTLTWRAAMIDRFIFGRLFGYERSQLASIWQRYLYALMCPLLPLLLVVRAARHVWRRGKHRLVFVRALPALALISTVWAAGELIGYLTQRPALRLMARGHSQSAVVRQEGKAIL